MANPSTINSPLRYPGGKAILSGFFAQLIEINGLSDGVYIEPYAGGAGAALNLLFSEYAHRIILNDADPCVFAFWEVIVSQPDEIIRLIRDTPITIEEWNKQRQVYLNQNNNSQVDVAFSGFFLNRCNRSGIMLNAGPIGGLKQGGEWKIDARYNKFDLVRRIEKISLYSDRISVFNLDAIDFLKVIVPQINELGKTLVFLDPPYYKKGKTLYLNYYLHEDHVKLSKFIKKQTSYKWIISYDNVSKVRELYKDMNQIEFKLRYSLNKKRVASELLIFNDHLKTPDDLSTLGIA